MLSVHFQKGKTEQNAIVFEMKYDFLNNVAEKSRRLSAGINRRRRRRVKIHRRRRNRRRQNGG